MRKFVLPLLAALLLIPLLQTPVSHAGFGATVDLSNPRIVPIYGSGKGMPPNQARESSYSGFLYSSRIVFSAAHSDYYFDSNGKVINREIPEIWVGLPNSEATNLNGLVRVTDRLVAKNYRFDNATLDDFVIYVLEKDLVEIEPASLLTKDLENELISLGAQVKMHGYGEYVDRCASGELLPCTQKQGLTNLPRSLTATLISLAQAENLVGYKRPQLADHLIFMNGKTGLGCGGDSGGSLTTYYKERLIYLGPTPNGMNAYSCGASGYYDGIGGIMYSSPIYKHFDLVTEAENLVAQRIEAEKRAFEELREKEVAKAEEEAKAKAESKAIVKNPKKISITCLKGKKAKKITAVNPKCPKGYTKK